MANQDIGAVHHKIYCGEVSGSTSAKVLPSVEGALFWVQANSDNAGKVYIGGSGVTVPNGTTDTTSGVHLNASDMIGPLTLANLNQLYIICTNATDDICYFVEA